MMGTGVMQRQKQQRDWYVIDPATMTVLWGPSGCGAAAVYADAHGGEVVATMPGSIPPHPRHAREGKAIPPPRRPKARRKPARASRR
jgi:hypothetical protein